MVADRKGMSVVCDDGEVYTVGERVKAIDQRSDYAGLEGVIVEIRTGKDKETTNPCDEITVDFECPEDPNLREELQARMSGLYGYLVKVEDLPLELIIMAPSMIKRIN